MIDVSKLLDAERVDSSLDLTFPETWHANLFAVTVELSREGHFTWAEWVERFSANESAQEPCETELDAYFARWLVELERLVDERLSLGKVEIAETAEHWRRSYIHTEHGQPVLLKKNLPEAGWEHHHHHHHGDSKAAMPVYVSEANVSSAETGN